MGAATLPVSVSSAVATAISLVVYVIHHHIEVGLVALLASSLSMVVAIVTVRLSQDWSRRTMLQRQVDAYLLCISLIALVRMIFGFSLYELLPGLCLAGWLFHRMLDAAWFDDLDRAVKGKPPAPETPNDPDPQSP